MRTPDVERRRIVLAMAGLCGRSLPVLAVAPAFLLETARAEPARWASEGWRTDFTRHVVPLEEILDGGPPRDGIPSIDAPRFRRASEIGELGPREPVIMFPLDGEARAYPLRVLIWHEIVNDVVDGTPVAVTYCPLCNTAMVFDRRLGDRMLEFGATGKLRHSDLVMYDRQTESWWQQFTGGSIVGGFAGRSLNLLPSRVVSFREYLATAGDGLVLVPPDPTRRRYGANPYVGYDGRLQPYGLFRGQLPRGLPPMTRVVVARAEEGIVAVEMSLVVSRRRLTHATLEFTWEAGMASALDAAEIAASRDVGSIAVTTRGGRPVVHEVTFASHCMPWRRMSRS